MFKKDIAFYLGQERTEGFSGFIAEDNFFLILEVEEGLPGDEGREVLKSVKEKVMKESVETLASFETKLNEVIKKSNLPADFSLAAGFINQNILYLKTAGTGEIFLHREGKFAQIIGGENTASGCLEKDDFFIFTTQNFTHVFGGEEKLKKIFDHKKPHQIVEEITPALKSQEDLGAIALFVQFSEEEALSQETSNFIYQPKPVERKKTLTTVFVITIFLILIWSVGFGYQRRYYAAMDKKISTTRELIKQKLQQADEVAFLNLPRALVLISESKQEVQKLGKELGNKKIKDVNELLSLITTEENKILKKEEKNYEEFFDLTVDNKKAQGNKLYLDSDQLAILDRNQGIVYSLSLTKKSLDKSSFNEIKNTKLIAAYQGDLFFFVNGDGIYKIDTQQKLKKVIDKDTDWGNIAAMWIYNGNIYLLDTGRDTIYKYLVADTGYSGKISYFKGGTAGLKDANSMAIDGSVYVGFSDKIFKFTSGEQDDFKTSFPDPSLSLTKVFTSRDLEKIYAWDKKKGAIYVLAKNGTYEREINSSILSKADDFAVYANAAYILAGPKIYKVSLD